MRVCTVAQMREMDGEAIEDLGIPEALLMENAGLAAAGVVERVTGGLAGLPVAVVCGTGNNGGDGLVVARVLHAAGAKVRVLVLGEPDTLRETARLNHDVAGRIGIELVHARQPGEIDGVLTGARVVVDAIFGTGLTRAVGGLPESAVTAINAIRETGATVVSLDIPTGVHGDTGAILGVAVHAHHTVTFGLPKLGNLLYPGHARGGQLWVSHISFPPALRERSTVARTNDPPALPPRVPGGHKGSFGDALFVAGSREYTGAPVLATMAHLRCGGGYARLAAPAAVGGALASGAREVVFHAQPQTATGSLSATCLPGLLAAAARSDIVVMGPGLSLDTEVRTVVLEAIRQVAAPLVLDGDALTHLAGSPETAVERTGALVLTPHPGEHARLLGWSLERVLDQRVQAVREAVSRYRAVVVAKGAHTLIGCPDGSLYVNLTGNNGMGTAGSGDVLTGTITAMHGLGLSLDLAARAAVFVHGLAGDLAATEMGADGMVASDILRMLPKAVRELRERRAELERDCYGKILRA